MLGLNNKYAVVPGWVPVDKTGGGSSDGISLKNYHQAEVYIITGAAVTQTAAVTMEQGVTVTTCTTALPFELYYTTGMMLKYDGASTGVAAAPGETAQGAGGGIMTINEDLGGILIGHWDNVTAFVNDEVLTFSGGKLAVVDGIRYNEDIMVPTALAAGVDTFNITQVLDVNKIFMVPINSSMLNEGMDCIELVIGDPLTPSLMVCFYILSQPRYAGLPMQTALYD